MDVPGDHAVDPRLVGAALALAAERAGVTLRPQTAVAQVLVRDGRVAGLELDGGERLAAEHVVIAAGPWSGALAGLPDAARVPVRPVKGQLLRLRDPGHDPAAPLLGRVIRHEGGYVVPRGDGRYVVGATVEERGFDTSVTALALHELLRDAAELVPGLLELEVEELLAGLRPGTPDNAPVLGPSAALPGLHWATGHHRNGILLAPVTGDLLAAALAGEDAPVAPGVLPRPLHRGARMIRVNGREVWGRDGATIAELLADLGVDADARGVAVAVDGEVIPQGEWPTLAVQDGSKVEAVTAVQGG